MVIEKLKELNQKIRSMSPEEFLEVWENRKVKRSGKYDRLAILLNLGDKEPCERCKGTGDSAECNCCTQKCMYCKGLGFR